MNFPRQTGEKPPKRRKRKLQKHGVYALKRALNKLGSRAIDRRTRLWRALEAWKQEQITDLGGPENVSIRQIDVIDTAMRTKLILDSIDAWILEQGEAAIIHKSKSTRALEALRKAVLADFQDAKLRARAFSLTDRIADLLKGGTESA